MITDKIGNRIRELRSHTGLSQEKFAQKIGMELILQALNSVNAIFQSSILKKSQTAWMYHFPSFLKIFESSPI